MELETVADGRRLGYVGSQVRKVEDSDNDDWYTPKEWIDLASRVLYGISLDPFSSEKANQIIRAEKIFTQQDSAFNHKWVAKSVWMNPPYSRGLCSDACEKFVYEYKCKNFKKGMILVNNMTDTKWYRELVENCSMLCNLTGRIGFENAAGQRVSGNTRGQTLFLFSEDGKTKNKFVKEMAILNQITLKKWNG